MHWCIGSKVGDKDGNWDGYLVRQGWPPNRNEDENNHHCDNRFPGKKYGGRKYIKKTLNYLCWNRIQCIRYVDQHDDGIYGDNEEKNYGNDFLLIAMHKLPLA